MKAQEITSEVVKKELEMMEKVIDKISEIEKLKTEYEALIKEQTNKYDSFGVIMNLIYEERIRSSKDRLNIIVPVHHLLRYEESLSDVMRVINTIKDLGFVVDPLYKSDKQVIGGKSIAAFCIEYDPKVITEKNKLKVMNNTIMITEAARL